LVTPAFSHRSAIHFLLNRYIHVFHPPPKPKLFLSLTPIAASDLPCTSSSLHSMGKAVMPELGAWGTVLLYLAAGTQPHLL
jgi:hypothetical protein